MLVITKQKRSMGLQLEIPGEGKQTEGYLKF